MARPRRVDEGELRMEMTPMIDCVFQLLIFFMICTEIAQSELEMLVLPRASEAVPDDPPERGRMVLNVTKDGRIRWRGQDLTRQGLHDRLALQARLRLQRETGLSDQAILIRSDSEAEYRNVQTILQECAKVRIWKIELAAATAAKPKGRE
ncbi:MAG: biopolymer transporter ExbD [Planctomycetales bacterium]|nr:biopolymer transporter ExbD [Planctomycetales bacterium]